MVRLIATATADTRYTFTVQYLEASTIFVRRARVIESMPIQDVDDSLRIEHRGLVCSVIFQCVAALDTETHETCTYGPGAYLGSDHTDDDSKAYLSPLATVIDDQDTMSRFNLVLHLLRKEPIDTGREPFQSAAMVVRLRNEIVHYKSRWGEEMKTSKLFSALEGKRFRPPPFFPPGGMNFFPHRCLSADCATWALKSSVNMLDAFYTAIGVPSRFSTYGNRLNP
jgi:hypothetical protein